MKEDPDLYEAYRAWKRASFPSFEAYEERYPKTTNPDRFPPPELMMAAEALAPKIKDLEANPHSRSALVVAVSLTRLYMEALEKDGFTVNKEVELDVPNDLKGLVREAADAALVHGS